MAQVQETLEEQQDAMPATDPAYEAWFRRQVEAGLQDVREGRVVSDGEAVTSAPYTRMTSRRNGFCS